MEKQKITEVVFIIDASGSMILLSEDVVGSINGVLEEKRKVAYSEKVLVTTVLFNNVTHFVHESAPILDVPLLTAEQYSPKGLTALFDAIGETIELLQNFRLYNRQKTTRTLVFIMTDGKENASRRFDRATIQKMIVDRQKEGWEFVFLAANINAEETARDIGIRKERAIGWLADERGVHKVGRGISLCMDSFVMEERCIREDFLEVDADFQTRKR